MRLQLHTPRHHAYLAAIAEDRARRIFDRFAERISSLNVNLSDENGPRGGTDLRAMGILVLRDGSTAVVSGRYADGRSAVTELMRRLRVSLQRLIRHRRSRRRS